MQILYIISEKWSQCRNALNLHSFEQPAGRISWGNYGSVIVARGQHIRSMWAVGWQSVRQIQTQSTCTERFLSDWDSLWVTLACAVAGPSASWGEETSPSLPLSTNYHSTDAQCHPHHALGCWDFGKLHKSNGGYWYFINNQLAFHSTIKHDML